MHRKTCTVLVIALVIFLGAGQAFCEKTIRYEGSTTIGKFIDLARGFYGKSMIMMNLMTESQGGEQCVLKGTCDIGGVARKVKPEVLEKGVTATLIGYDALAVIVSSKNPINELSMVQIKDIFSGKIVNWKDVGGPDHPIEVLITAPKSATNEIFRKIVLKGAEYDAKIIDPDSEIVLRVSKNKYAIGRIRFFFIGKAKDVKPIKPNGEAATFKNPNYPISRPLYLVTKGPPRGKDKAFIDWVLSPEGQALVEKFFIGIRPAKKGVGLN